MELQVQLPPVGSVRLTMVVVDEEGWLRYVDVVLSAEEYSTLTPRRLDERYFLPMAYAVKECARD